MNKTSEKLMHGSGQILMALHAGMILMEKSNGRYAWVGRVRQRPALNNKYIAPLFLADLIESRKKQVVLTPAGTIMARNAGATCKECGMRYGHTTECRRKGMIKVGNIISETNIAKTLPCPAKFRMPVVLPEGSDAKVDIPATSAFQRGQRAERVRLLMRIVKVMMKEIEQEMKSGGLEEQVSFQLTIVNDALDSIDSVL